VKYLLSVLIISFFYYWIKARKEFYPPFIVIIFPLLLIFVGLMMTTVSGFIWAIITLLIWWQISSFNRKKEEWKILFSFNTNFSILFFLGLIIIGPLVGIFSVPEVILDHPEPNLYFHYLFRTGVLFGFILGTIAGISSLPGKTKLH
jgi:hypothetical protein